MRALIHRPSSFVVALSLTLAIALAGRADAYQPLCWRCIYVSFLGAYCDSTGGFAGDCFDWGDHCLLVGSCANNVRVTP